MKTKHISLWYVFVVTVLLLTWSPLLAQEEAKTVIGPRNPPLAEGAEALLAGDAESGIRLTLSGLEFAQGDREKKTAHANLCAGYVMIDKLLTAIEHCNQALEYDPNFWSAYNNRALAYLKLGRFEESEADIAKGQALRPKSTKLKEVKGLLLDATDPVEERIEVDERRRSPEDEGLQQ